jgi:hypothetical protein
MSQGGNFMDRDDLFSSELFPNVALESLLFASFAVLNGTGFSGKTTPSIHFLSQISTLAIMRYLLRAAVSLFSSCLIISD